MRAAPLNTASARRLMSPKLPIGVATRDSPGASSVAPAGCSPSAAVETGGVLGSALRVTERRVGCRLLPAFLSEPALAAPVALAVRLTLCRPRHGSACLLRSGDGTGPGGEPPPPLFRFGPGPPTAPACPPVAADRGRRGTRQSGLARSVVGRECRA